MPASRGRWFLGPGCSKVDRANSSGICFEPLINAGLVQSCWALVKLAVEFVGNIILHIKYYNDTKLFYRLKIDY